MIPDSSHSPARILIVDDDPDIVLSLKDLLVGEGYLVRVASTGQMGWDCLKEESIDTVLLDICLPDTDGLLMLANLTQSFPGLPVIILSGLPTLDQVTGPLDQQGAFAYLKKPIDRGQIKTNVRLAVKAHGLALQMKRTQRALVDSELRFQAIFQTANDAIVLADAQGRITGWNRAAQSMFGYSEAEVFGQPLTLLMPSRYREAHVQGLKRVSTTNETKVIGKTVTLHGLRKNGEEFPIELSLNAWATDTHPSYSGFIRDRSEQKILTTATTSLLGRPWDNG
ncbi:MAG: PAS domain S-box protein [Nitrospirales bacterium]